MKIENKDIHKIENHRLKKIVLKTCPIQRKAIPLQPEKKKKDFQFNQNLLKAC
ncbi:MULTISPECIES: hypothetical protein [Bacteroidaceae]|uniref:Uncharacterized protein n=1 Tax=Phocaeicola intestinalis TaxID=2762212 RepID=A0ABR8Y4I6_9BACT|nr:MULTISPECIES: hypothetical protein [Bacteroidaceae]MBD8039115.1 hypothetical protein [Phocaeicola intestinalis]MBM6660002.1 hypothetical protein [Bacteroides gallinaceum]